MHNGVRNVKVDDLASELGISKRTLYEMFVDKETLLVECLKLQTQNSAETFQKFKEESCNSLETYLKWHKNQIKELREASSQFFSDMKRYGKVTAYFDTATKKRNEAGINFINECVKEGLFRNDIDYKVLIHTFNYIAEGIMEDELYKIYGFDELFNYIDFIHIRGMCTEKGLHILEKFQQNSEKRRRRWNYDKSILETEEEL